MASRAILRRQKSLFNSLNQPTCLLRGFSSFNHGQPDQSNNLHGSSWIFSHPSGRTDSINGGVSSVIGDEMSNFLSADFPRHNYNGFAALGYGIRKAYFVSPSAIRWFSQSVRNSSTATAGQPEFGRGNDENEQQAAKQVKEASPEECDEAVEDLTEAKAKAKAKQVQESQKSAKSIVQRVWAMLLGFGPALRAVASMSRLKIIHLIAFGLS